MAFPFVGELGIKSQVQQFESCSIYLSKISAVVFYPNILRGLSLISLATPSLQFWDTQLYR